MLRHAIPDIDLRRRLAERGLECHLLIRDHQQAAGGEEEESFHALLCAELQELVYLAYDKSLTADHLRYENWGVTLRRAEPPNAVVVACSTLAFTFDDPSYFHTRFEAVHPEWQRKGVGRLLFDCLAVWARFLAIHDPLALDGIVRSDGRYCLVSVIDRSPLQRVAECDDGTGSDPDSLTDAEAEESDNAEGHGTFLKRLGFARAVHDFGQDIRSEIAFQRDFHIPFEPSWLKKRTQEDERAEQDSNSSRQQRRRQQLSETCQRARGESSNDDQGQQ